MRSRQPGGKKRRRHERFSPAGLGVADTIAESSLTSLGGQQRTAVLLCAQRRGQPRKNHDLQHSCSSDLLFFLFEYYVLEKCF